MNDEMKKPSFLVYYDNEVVISRLTDEEAGKLFKSLFSYEREENKPDFEKNPALAMAFDILSMAIDRDKEKYMKRCESNRENGRKGGRPKKIPTDTEETKKSERLDSKPKKADMDKDMGREGKREKNKNTMCKADALALFERLWELYPVKKGKAQVSMAAKQRLLKVGYEEMTRAIDRYKADLEKDSSWRKPQNGSTFFNSGYVDYLDENYKKQETEEGGKTQYKSYEEFEKELREALGKDGSV